MNTRGLTILASLVLLCAVVAPAAAGLSPYVRFDYGGSGLKMTGENNVIRDDETVFNDAGYAFEFERIGAGYGPSAAAGLWLVPGLRVGGTASYLRAVRHYGVEALDQSFLFDRQIDLRMTEIGVEAAVRSARLWGLTLGANLAQGRGDLTEMLTLDNAHGPYFGKSRAHRTRTTFGGYVGLEQVNAAGVVGYLRLGYQHRDFGRMAADVTETDATGTFQSTDQTPLLDYSGLYLKLGIGYDLVR